jgi:hypothetical protein
VLGEFDAHQCDSALTAAGEAISNHKDSRSRSQRPRRKRFARATAGDAGALRDAPGSRDAVKELKESGIDFIYEERAQARARRSPRRR